MIKIRKEAELPKLYYIFNNILKYLEKSTNFREKVLLYIIILSFYQTFYY